MYIITGGGSGIGCALAHALAQRGKSVLIIGRREKALAATAAFSPLIQWFCADISSAEGRENLSAHLKAYATIDGLVHNAALIEPISLLENVDAAAWEKSFATNLHAPLFLTQLLLPKLQQGRVLHIGSGVAHFPVKAWGAYCVSKAALCMLTQCWQLEMESHSLAFASVMPGIVDTDMQALAREGIGMDNEKRAFFKKLKRENRLLSTETVALFLSWLLLDISVEEYVSKEWDMYDQSHHAKWLVKPHVVPHWE